MPRHRSRSRSRSRSQDRDRKRRDRDRNIHDKHNDRKKQYTKNSDDKSAAKSFPIKAEDIKWGKQEPEKSGQAQEPKQKPSFETSGKLMEDTNMFRGRIIKYNEPPEAMKPRKRWRFYPFKGDEALPVIYIHRQSAYLIGSDRVVCDFPVDHPSCSKQHAVLQYRLVPFTKPDGSNGNLYLLII